MRLQTALYQDFPEVPKSCPIVRLESISKPDFTSKNLLGIVTCTLIQYLDRGIRHSDAKRREFSYTR